MRSHLLIPFPPIYSICRWSHIQTLGWKREEVPTTTTSTTSHNTATTPLSTKANSSRFKKRYVNEALIATTSNKPHGHGQWWTPAPHIINKDSTDRVYTFDTLTNRAKIFLHYMLSSSLAAHPLALPSTTGAADLLLQLGRERGTIETNYSSSGGVRSRVDQRLNGNTGAASSVAAEAREASAAAPVIEREEDVLSDSDDDEGGPVIAFRAPPRAPSVISPLLSTVAPQASNQAPSQPSTADSTTLLASSITTTGPRLNTPSTHPIVPSISVAINPTHALKPTRPLPPLDKPAPKKRKVATKPALLTPSDLDGLSFTSNFYSTSIPLLDTGVYTIPPPRDGSRNKLPANYLRLKSTSNGSILYPIQSSARNAPTPVLASVPNTSTIGVRVPTLPFSPFTTTTLTAPIIAHSTLPSTNPTPTSSSTATIATTNIHTFNTVNQQRSSSSGSGSASASSSSDLPYYTTPQDSHFTPTLTLALSGDDSNSNSTLIHGNMFTTASGQNYDPHTACLYDYENSLFR